MRVIYYEYMDAACLFIDGSPCGGGISFSLFFFFHVRMRAHKNSHLESPCDWSGAMEGRWGWGGGGG